MTTPRPYAGALLSKGVLSTGWDSVLTGLALLVVGWVLGRVPFGYDPAAGVVGVVAFLGGAFMVQRGLRAEYKRRPRPGDAESRP